MPKDTKTLGNNKARACESLGFVHKKRLCQRFDTTSCRNEATRTPDPYVPNVVRYQLRYIPLSKVVPPGIEPGTQGFSVLCSTN